jgi:hypothetical protein
VISSLDAGMDADVMSDSKGGKIVQKNAIARTKTVEA